MNTIANVSYVPRKLVANSKFLMQAAMRKPKFLLRLANGLLKARFMNASPLRLVDIAVDYVCNMKCVHCSASRLAQPKNKPLSLEEYARIAEELQNEGAVIFHMTGGEPFLRKDLEDVIQTFRPERCGIGIQTNGLLATRERLASCRKAGADFLCVSIDSGFSEEHDEFRQHSGAYEKALLAVDTAKELGYQTMISTCLSHDSIKSEGLAKVIRLAEDRGIWCSMNLASPSGNWQDQADSLLSSEDQKYWRDMFKKHPACHIDLHHNWYKVGCGNVKEKLYITAYGDVMPCPFIQVSLGNLREESIFQIRSRAMKFEKFKHHSPICLAAEDMDFIRNTPCYHKELSAQLPIPWTNVPDMKEVMER